MEATGAGGRWTKRHGPWESFAARSDILGFNLQREVWLPCRGEQKGSTKAAGRGPCGHRIRSAPV